MNMRTKVVALLDELSVPYKAIKYVSELCDDLYIIDVCRYEKDLVLKFGGEVFNKLKNAISVENIEKTVSKLKKYQIKAISIYDSEYPESLKNISAPPLIIYYKGDVKLLSSISIAIVGTRRPTAYGRQVTRYFASNLAKAGLTTVSGLAYGLDMEVALSTLEANGKTIAVLGGGLDKIYPSQNTALAERIVESGGLLISLYPPLRRPTKYSFVDRNRVISGLSLGTIICEAGESSGTLNTANHAIEQGKELFVVPGNIFSKSNVGSNELINQMPETYTINYEHVLKTLRIEPPKAVEKQKMARDVSLDEKVVLECLYECDLDFEALKSKTQLESKSLISLLTMMEISGLIKKLPNNYYSLAGNEKF